MDEARLLDLASSSPRTCGGLDGGLAIAGSVLRTLRGSPTFDAPNQEGASSEPRLCDASLKGVERTPKLVALRCDGPCCDAVTVCATSAPTFRGRAGTGGISSGAIWPRDWLCCRCADPPLPGRCGLGLRNVLSVMEPLLPRLCRPGLPWPSDEAADEAADPLRRMVRLVWTSATRVGVIGRAARAAAAAAADSDEFDSWRLKTAAAAVAALGFALAAVSGCFVGDIVSRCSTGVVDVRVSRDTRNSNTKLAMFAYHATTRGSCMMTATTVAHPPETRTIICRRVFPIPRYGANHESRPRGLGVAVAVVMHNEARIQSKRETT